MIDCSSRIEISIEPESDESPGNIMNSFSSKSYPLVDQYESQSELEKIIEIKNREISELKNIV